MYHPYPPLQGQVRKPAATDGHLTLLVVENRGRRALTEVIKSDSEIGYDNIKIHGPAGNAARQPWDKISCRRGLKKVESGRFGPQRSQQVQLSSNQPHYRACCLLPRPLSASI